MTKNLPGNLLEQLARIITRQTGILFTKDRYDDLAGGILVLSQEFGFRDLETCVNWLLSSYPSTNQAKILAMYITIGETYFFRDPIFFQILQKKILPGLLDLKSVDHPCVKIWHAGCSTGEEPYSIAMLLRETIHDLDRWRLTIIATDFNLNSLGKAQKGIYSQWSFRTKISFIKKYFDCINGNEYRIKSDVSRMVKFSYLNLVDEFYSGSDHKYADMDIIFCRNVLMYFSRKQAKKVIDRFYRSLSEGGYLVLGPCESRIAQDSNFQAISFNNTIVFKKETELSRSTNLRIDRRPDYCVQVGTYSSPVVAASPPLALSVVDTQEPRPSVSVLYKDAVAHYKRGNYQKAVERLSKCLQAPILAENEKAGLTIGVMMMLARISANQGEMMEALQWCHRLEQEDKLNPASRFFHAVIFLENGEVEKAIKKLQDAIYLDQDFILAYYLLGNQLLLLDKEQTAYRYFNTALILLGKVDKDVLLPESDGLPAGRLQEVINHIIVTCNHDGLAKSPEKNCNYAARVDNRP